MRLLGSSMISLYIRCTTEPIKARSGGCEWFVGGVWSVGALVFIYIRCTTEPIKARSGGCEWFVGGVWSVGALVFYEIQLGCTRADVAARKRGMYLSVIIHSARMLVWRK